MPAFAYIFHKNDMKINGGDYVGKLFMLWKTRCYKMPRWYYFYCSLFLLNVASFIDALKMYIW